MTIRAPATAQHGVHGLQHADRRAHGEAVPASPPHREERPQRRYERGYQADSVLGWIPGAPEDAKKALVEGASWWNQAFEAAGFINGFKVAGAACRRRPHGYPLQHRSTGCTARRAAGGTGGSVSDPRTGEIIKATVTLGSLRDRQDYMIFEGNLLSPYTNGTEKPEILVSDGAGAHPPVGGAAKWATHARPGPQLLRQQQGLDFRDGLSASPGGTAPQTYHRYLRTPARRASASGIRWRSTTAIASFPRETAPRRSARSSTTRGRWTCAT